MKIITLVILFILASCVAEDNTLTLTMKGKAAGSVQYVAFDNGQIILSGSLLSEVQTVKLIGEDGFSESLSIESSSDNSLVVNMERVASLALDGVFSLVISDAFGSTSFPITFELTDGSVTSPKIHDMGASSGDVLQFDGSTWGPAPIADSGLSFQAAFDATSIIDQTTLTPEDRHFYVVTTAGTNDPDGANTSISWNLGDWAVYNKTTLSWDQIPATSSVTSVFGRANGAIVAEAGDYTWAQIDKTVSSLGDIADVETVGISTGQILKWDGSKWAIADDKMITSLNDIADVETVGISTGQILKWDGSKWAIGDDLSHGGEGSVSSSEISDGTIEDTDISDTAAIAQSKIVGLTDLVTQVDTNQTDIATKPTKPGVNCDGTNKLQWNGSSFICASDTSVHAGTICSAGQYLDGDGTCKIVNTVVDTNTHAGSICLADQYLDGDGACKAVTTGDLKANGTVAMTANFNLGTSQIVGASGTSGISILNNGNVGIGAVSPTVKLEINGAAITAAPVVDNDGTIDFLNGNLQYTTSNCGAFNLHNLKSGGTYSFAVQGTSSTTCSFNAYSGAGTSPLTVHLPPGHKPTIAGKHTVYSIMIMGTHAYFAWIAGF